VFDSFRAEDRPSQQQMIIVYIEFGYNMFPPE